MKILWGSRQDVINVSQAGQKSSEIVLMRIWAWAFHLDNNTFEVGCKGKDSPDCLGDHVTNSPAPGLRCLCVCDHFAAKAMLHSMSGTNEERRGGRTISG